MGLVLLKKVVFGKVLNTSSRFIGFHLKFNLNHVLLPITPFQLPLLIKSVVQRALQGILSFDLKVSPKV